MENKKHNQTQDKKKKRKIILATLIPVGVLAATTAILTPTVIACNRKTNSNVVFGPITKIDGVSIKSSHIVKGQDSTFELNTPSDKTIDDIKLLIGNMGIQKSELTIDGNKVTIPANKMVENKVTIVTLTLKSSPVPEKKYTITVTGDADVISQEIINSKLVIKLKSKIESQVIVDINSLKVASKEIQYKFDATTQTILIEKAVLDVNPGTISIDVKLDLPIVEMTKEEFLDKYQYFCDEFNKKDDVLCTNFIKSFKIDGEECEISYINFGWTQSKKKRINLDGNFPSSNFNSPFGCSRLTKNRISGYIEEDGNQGFKYSIDNINKLLTAEKKEEGTETVLAKYQFTFNGFYTTIYSKNNELNFEFEYNKEYDIHDILHWKLSETAVEAGITFNQYEYYYSYADNTIKYDCILNQENAVVDNITWNSEKLAFTTVVQTSLGLEINLSDTYKIDDYGDVVIEAHLV